MSASFHRFTAKVDPLGHAIVESLFGIDKSANEAAAAEKAARDAAAKQSADEAAAAERMQTHQVDTRPQALGTPDSAAGVTHAGGATRWLVGGNSGAARKGYKFLLGQ